MNRSRRRAKNSIEPKTLLIIVIAALIIAASIVAMVILNSGNEEELPPVDPEALFAQGVMINGVDVSGLTYEEALLLMQSSDDSGGAGNLTINTPEVEVGVVISTATSDTISEIDVSGETGPDSIEEIDQAAMSATGGQSVEVDANVVEVEEHSFVYTLSLESLGYIPDYDATLRSVMEHSSNSPTLTEQNYGLQITFDEAMLDATLAQFAQDARVVATDAQVSVETSSVEEPKNAVNEDHDVLTTSGEMVYIEEKKGYDIDVDGLKVLIEQAIAAGNINLPITAPVVETVPEVTIETLKQNSELIGSYTTTFKNSNAGRRYNVWKMATVVNGIVLQPGEEWSINDAAGPRTTELGWGSAAGIVNGAYVDEPGGGICQTSSTLYVACLEANLTIVKRAHHSWPLDYVPTGMDATISTGGPDFVFANPYDYPITVLVNTDAEDEREITVNIYGPPQEYDYEYVSEIVSTTDPEPAVTVVDEEMEPGTSIQTKPTKPQIVVDVYRVFLDKETGEEVNREKAYSDTYRAFAGEYTVGPSASPSATPSESTLPTETTTTEPEPEPEPEPTPTQTPSEEPSDPPTESETTE